MLFPRRSKKFLNLKREDLENRKAAKLARARTATPACNTIFRRRMGRFLHERAVGI